MYLNLSSILFSPQQGKGLCTRWDIPGAPAGLTIGMFRVSLPCSPWLQWRADILFPDGADWIRCGGASGVSAPFNRAPETPPLQRTWLARSEPRSSPDKSSLVCSHYLAHRKLLWAIESFPEDAHVFGCTAAQMGALHGKYLFSFVQHRELLGRDLASLVVDVH